MLMNRKNRTECHMKRITAVVLFLLALVTPVFAEDAAEPESDGSAALGMYYILGKFNMIGLSYHQWFGNHALMVSAGVQSDQMSALAEYQYCVFSAHLTETLNSRLYVWASGGVNVRNESVHEWEPDLTLWQNEVHVNAVTSLGVGMEFVWWRHLSVPVQFGYVAEYPFDFGMSFCFSSGVRYRF